MAFKIINDTVINDSTDIRVDGMDVLVGDGDSSTKVMLQNVTLESSVDLATNLTTDDLPEGIINEYYTDAKVQAQIANEITANLLADTTYVDAGDATTLSDANTYADNGDAATLQSAQSYADSVVTSGTGNLTTDDIPEGANLYYTNGRVASYIGTTTLADEAFVTAEANAVAGTLSSQALTNAQNYTDGEIVTVTNSLQAYADRAEADAISTSNNYADAVALTAETNANTYTDTEVANLVDSAPATLDTLNELASALGDDPNFATTLSNNIGTKVAKAGDTMTGALTLSGAPTSANHAATKAYVDSAVSTGTGALDTDSVPEGALNLYYTDARADARATLRINAATTDNISEGTNLYYTDARVQNVIDTNTAGFVTTDTTYTAGEGLNLTGTEFAMSGSYTGDFNVDGEIIATGDVTAYSDRALKRNIQTIENALDKVIAMRGVTYQKDEKDGLGVIAQEVEEVLPEVVRQDQHGMRSVAYGNIVGVLIEAIKEQQKQIEELKSKINK